MLDHLAQLIGQSGIWGYFLIFLVVLLECQPLFGLFMPGESAVVLAGFLAGQSLLDPFVLIAVVTGAAATGDSIGFELGRRYGKDWLVKWEGKFGVQQTRLGRVEAFFHAHGGKAVFAGHFTHVMRAMMSFVAGTSRMSSWKFLLCNAMGCFVWSICFVLAGYLAGEHWQLVSKWLGRTGEFVLLVIILGGVSIILRQNFRS